MAAVAVVLRGSTRLAHILGVPLADDVVRQWPQMGEIVRGRKLIGQIEGNFEELTLAVGARYQLGDILVVEWSNDYGDGAIYRNGACGPLALPRKPGASLITHDPGKTALADATHADDMPRNRRVVRDQVQDR